MARKIHYEVSDEEEAAVAEALKGYRDQVRASPELTSLLYDIDLLPEQIAHMANAGRMIAVCALFAKLPPEAVKELFHSEVA